MKSANQTNRHYLLPSMDQSGVNEISNFLISYSAYSKGSDSLSD